MSAAHDLRIDWSRVADDQARMASRLRDYQLAAHAALDKDWATFAALMLVLPTGTGKTLTSLFKVVEAVQRGQRVLWLAHTKILVDQARDALRQHWPSLAEVVGTVRGEFDEPDQPIVFASVQTLARENRLAAVLEAGAPGFVVVDEAHHSVSPSQIALLDRLNASGQRRLGITATVERKGLGDRWRVAYQYQLNRAFADGYLVPPRIDVVRLPDLDDLLAELPDDRDFDDEELGRALMLAGVVDHTVDALRDRAAGRNGVIFTATIEQARASAEAANKAGLRAAWLCGNHSDEERVRVLGGLRDGSIRFVFNAAVLTEGFDCPSIDLVMVARPTRSKTLYIQAVGRGLRPYPGKTDCLVIDIAGASNEHSLIQAGVLLEGDEPAVDEDDEEKPPTIAAPKDHNPYAGMFGFRGRSKFSWLPVPGIDRPAFVLGLSGDHGKVVLVQDQASTTWQGWHIPRQRDRAPAPLDDRPGELTWVSALGEDLARRTSSGAIARVDVKWRQEPPSASQLQTLRNMRISSIPKDAGTASDLITRTGAGWDLVRLGLARKGNRP